MDLIMSDKNHIQFTLFIKYYKIIFYSYNVRLFIFFSNINYKYYEIYLDCEEI